MTASHVLRTALVALLLLDAPLISADWFGWLGSRASDGLSYVSRAAVELEKNAATLSVDGRAPSSARHSGWTGPVQPNAHLPTVASVARRSCRWQ